MNKKMIISLVSTVLIAILIITVSFAWYTNVKKTSSVEFVSNGKILEYKIGSSQETNVDEFEVEGVSFFDVDDPNEGYYFSDMSVLVELNITNYSNTAVTLSLEGETQKHTLGAISEDNTISIYSYSGNTKNDLDVEAYVTRETFNSFSGLYTYNYNSTTRKYEYLEALKYTSGETYYQRELIATIEATISNDKITNATSTDKSLLIDVLNDGTEIAIEKYFEVSKEDLDIDIFTAGNAGIYYTKGKDENENDIYTQAKEFDSNTQYYELRTVAFLDDISISSEKIDSIGYAVSGPYISCAISDSRLDSKRYNYEVVDTTGFNSQTDVSQYYVLNNSKYVKATGNYQSGTTYYNQKPILNNLSVNQFLNGTYSNRFTYPQNLTNITPTVDSNGNVTKIEAGMTVKVYVYIYGVQPYDNAKNNFLEDKLNVYPFSLTIKAE